MSNHSLFTHKEFPYQNIMFDTELYNIFASMQHYKFDINQNKIISDFDKCVKIIFGTFILNNNLLLS